MKAKIRIPAFAGMTPLLLAAFLLAGCWGPSYPREKAAESLVKICRQEYGLDVKAELAGTTLGAQVVLPGLLDELRKEAGASSLDLPGLLIEGHYADRAFDFRLLTSGPFVHAQKEPEKDRGPREPSEVMKKLQHVSTAIHRVSLSTDAPLEFYTLVARDPGPENVELVFSGHIMDSKRFQYYAIPMSEMQTRSESSLRYQVDTAAVETVRRFFHEMGRYSLTQMLSRYTAPSKRFSELMPKVLATAAELNGRQGELLKHPWPVRQVGPHEALVYVPLEPVGRPGAMLFTVEVAATGAGSFLEIERLPPAAMPARYEALGSPSQWANRLYVEPLSLPKFLSEQIAKRVMAQFKSAEQPAAEKENVQKPAEEKQEKGKKKPAAPAPATPEDVVRELASAAAYVTQSYEFKDFEEMTVVDALQGTRWVISSKEIPLFRRKNPPALAPLP